MKNRKVSGNDFPALHYAPDSYRDCALQQQTTNNEQQTTNNKQIIMQAVYKLMANEVDEEFIKAIRMLFKDQIINITIDSLSDETTYLSSSQANLEHLNENAASTEKKYFAGNSFQSFVNESIEKAK